MASYHIETYGCTSNRGESRQIERKLRDAGHHPADTPELADVAILNTCTVVETTEHRMLRRARALEETTDDLIITGCMALAQGETFQDVGIDARVCHWDSVPQAVGNGECPRPTSDAEPVLDGVIGILPIARGCMSDCSYCITKQATGKINSPPLEENLAKARALIHAGAKELRITGQDTGVYGWDNGERQLHVLLDRICTEIKGDFMVRVGMANPKGIHGIREELAETFLAHDELYNFLHIPVQSGSDDVLGDMRRQHQVSEFVEVVETFDERLAEWTLSTDLIVGFPTETEADFEQTMELVRAVRPEKINVTRFSKRPNTDAAEMDGLGGQTKKDRSKVLSELKAEVMADAYEELLGTQREVVAIEPGRDDSMKCRDQAYHQIVVPEASTAGIKPGDRAQVSITAAETVYAFGHPV